MLDVAPRVCGGHSAASVAREGGGLSEVPVEPASQGWTSGPRAQAPCPTLSRTEGLPFQSDVKVLLLGCLSSHLSRGPGPWVGAALEEVPICSPRRGIRTKATPAPCPHSSPSPASFCLCSSCSSHDFSPCLSHLLAFQKL